MINKNRTGLILGCFFAVLHLIWAILVVAGVAQSLLDFIYRMHFLNNPFTVAKFEVLNALLLIVITFLIGYVAGWFFCFLCEKIQVRK